MTIESGHEHSFTVPTTVQGLQVSTAMTALFERGWQGTPVESLFERVDNNKPLRERHISQLSGAIIAAANEELTSDALAGLAERHQDAAIEPAQFDYVLGEVASTLIEHGEAATVNAIMPLVPTLRDAFVRQP
jgi:hypothetical protein